MRYALRRSPVSLSRSRSRRSPGALAAAASGFLAVVFDGCRLVDVNQAGAVAKSAGSRSRSPAGYCPVDKVFGLVYVPAWYHM